jgi:histidinol-phosphate/aromatic aminotransferase/cobyric acid decarboxylase-like protein
VGYLAADPARIAPWEAYSPPWSVGLLAQVAAVRALQHYDYYAARAQETHRLRNALAQELSQIPGLEPLPSDTNFLLIRTQRPAAQLVAQLRERNLFWRDCDSLSPRFQGRYVRTAVKDAATNQRMVQIVSDVMRG